MYTGTGVGNDLSSHSYTLTGAIDCSYVQPESGYGSSREFQSAGWPHKKCTDTVTSAQLGIANPNPDQISESKAMAAYPRHRGIGAASLGQGSAGFGQGYECPTIDHDTVFPFSDTWTKSFGKHSFKGGAEISCATATTGSRCRAAEDSEGAGRSSSVPTITGELLRRRRGLPSSASTAPP